MNPSPAEATPSPTMPNWVATSGWWLVLAFIAAMPFGHLFELPMLLMAILGLWLAFTQRQALAGWPAVRLLLVMAACFWLPMAASLPDAANLSRATETTLTFLRFPLAGVFILAALQRAESRSRLLNGVAALLSLSAVGLVLHATQGTLTQLPAPVLRAAQFCAGQRAIGHLLAVMAPLYLYWVWTHARRRPTLWLAAILYILAVLFSGARVAWIMLLATLLALVVQLVWVEKIRLRWKPLALVALLGALALGTAFKQPYLHDRAMQTAGLFSGNYEQLNTATSLRLPIWKVAGRVIQDHWINGVGPRGFRYVYYDYADQDDYFVANHRDVTHPHQMVLEILAETGLIGLLGYLAALFRWGRLLAAGAREQKFTALPVLMAALIAMMPFNAHMAFYASFWSSITWWLVALGLAFWQWGAARE